MHGEDEWKTKTAPTGNCASTETGRVKHYFSSLQFCNLKSYLFSFAVSMTAEEELWQCDVASGSHKFSKVFLLCAAYSPSCPHSRLRYHFLSSSPSAVKREKK